MSHYYDENQYTKSNRKEISFRFWCLDYTFIVDNGVFSKERFDTGTKILLDAIKNIDIKDTILDLGCGYGVIGVILKKYYKDKTITMADINSRAIELSKDNALKNDVDVEVLQSNIYSSLNERFFDTIITNPPIRAGKKVIYQMFDEAYDHLNDEGKLVIVIRKNHGALSAKKHLEEIYQQVNILDKDKGFFVIEAIKKV